MKPIVGYEAEYDICADGRINSKLTNKTVKHSFNPMYRVPYVALWQGEQMTPWAVHRLVATHYVPNPKSYPNIRHRDNNTKNPVSENLVWTEQEEYSDSAADVRMFFLDMLIQSFLSGIRIEHVAKSQNIDLEQFKPLFLHEAENVGYGPLVQIELDRQAKLNNRSYNKGKRQKVLQFTKQGEFVAEYASLTQAAAAMNANNVSNISQVLSPNSRNRIAYGYLWKYA